MKPTRILALCAVCVCAMSCHRYTIDGKVPDTWNGGKAYLAHYDGRKLLLDDSTAIADGTFQFKGSQDTVFYRQLLLDKDGERDMAAPVILEKGRISVTYDGRNATIGGTAQNDVLQQYLDLVRGAENMLDSLYQVYAASDNNPQRQRAIEEEFDSCYSALLETAIDYIKQNTDNAAGAYVFVSLSLDDEDQIEILEKASENFLCQPGVAAIAARLEKMKQVAIGKKFADLTMHDVNGNEAHLSDFVGNGRYLVVDFWASWCRPCRQSMPELKAIYKKYGDKIDIVGISFDNDEAAWKRCIDNLELPWHHMSDLKGWQSVAAEVYGIDAIPHLMLIDPDGIIVAKKLNDRSLAEKLEELLH